MTLFPVIRDWIVEFLDDNKDMTASMVGRNMLIEQVRKKSAVNLASVNLYYSWIIISVIIIMC